MTEPTQRVAAQDDLTADDVLVEPTGNGLQAYDPSSQPSQDPSWMPTAEPGEHLGQLVDTVGGVARWDGTSWVLQ